jgi:hypothetical protein
MSIIVEVGAHHGAETFNFLADAEASVYAFEPEIQQFKELLLKAKHYPRLTLLPFAVDIGDNQEPLFHYEDGRSTLQPAFGTNITGFTMTWTIRLDTFMYLYSVERIDYLRIDAPFREEMILESLGAKIDTLERGRVRRYGERSVVPTWLLDHGFHIELDTTSDNLTEPDIRFWRT